MVVDLNSPTTHPLYFIVAVVSKAIGSDRYWDLFMCLRAASDITVTHVQLLMLAGQAETRFNCSADAAAAANVYCSPSSSAILL